MFNLATNTKLRGIGYKALNVLRPCNIVALLAVTAASWVMIVMTGVTGQFFFFDAVAHVFVSSAALFLVLTEVQFGPLQRYFARAWPVFADRHGFFWLGAGMVVLGCDMLANLNKPAFSAANLGLPLWRLILAAGILSLTFGLANLAATLVFRDPAAGLTARMIRADGNLADAGKLGPGVHHPYDGPGSSGASSLDYYAASSLPSRAGTARYVKKDDAGSSFDDATTYTETSQTGGPRAAAAAARGSVAGYAGVAADRVRRLTQVFKRGPFAGHGGHDEEAAPASSRPQISRPIAVHHHRLGGEDEDGAADDAAFSPHHGDYYPHTDELASADRADRADRASPILPSIRRPPTALHPAMSSSSHYSVADMPRF